MDSEEVAEEAVVAGTATGTEAEVVGARVMVGHGTGEVWQGIGGTMGMIGVRCPMVGASDRVEGANRGGAGGEVPDADLPPDSHASFELRVTAGNPGGEFGYADGGGASLARVYSQAEVRSAHVSGRPGETRWQSAGLGAEGSCATSTRSLCGAMPRFDREDACVGGAGAEDWRRDTGEHEQWRKDRNFLGAFDAASEGKNYSVIDDQNLCDHVDQAMALDVDGSGSRRVGRGAGGSVSRASGAGGGSLAEECSGLDGSLPACCRDQRRDWTVSICGADGRAAPDGDCEDVSSGRSWGVPSVGRAPGVCATGVWIGRGVGRPIPQEQQEGVEVRARTDFGVASRVDAAVEGGGVALACDGGRGRGSASGVWGRDEGMCSERCASVSTSYGKESIRECGGPGRDRAGGGGLGTPSFGSSRRFEDGVQVSGGLDHPSGGGTTGTPAEGRGHVGPAVSVRGLALTMGAYDLLSEVEIAAGYAVCPMSGVGLERGPSQGRSSETGRDLPTPIVETVDVESLLPWVFEGDRWILEAMCSWGCFVKHVLGSEDVLAGVVDARLVNVSANRLRRMVELRYVRRIRIGSSVKGGVACAVMFVPKDDEYDRLIWNGIPLNRRCQRPPPVAFVPIHEMLRALGTSRVVWALSYDFATWFIQLRVHPDVQRVFLIRCQDGSLWRITGVPMGFAWAPVVAQVIAESIVAEALRRIDDQRVRAFIYIDNVMLFFEGDCDSSFVESVDRVFRQVCAEAGAVLKESAFVSGVQQDWLGIELVVGQSLAQLRRKFCEKVAALWDVLRDESAVELQVWWRMCALVVRSLWVTARPLATVGDVMSWMSRKAKEMQEGRVGWRTKVDMWSLARRQLAAVVDWVRLGGSFRIIVPADRVIACGVSDAASAGAARGFVFRVGRRLRMVRLANDDDGPHINVLEFQAAVAGITEVWQSCTESGWLVWGSDSTVAMGWIRLGWSPEVRRNGMLLELFDVMRKGVDRELRLVKVPGGPKNVADVLTRNGRGMLARGRSWCRDGWLSCGCRGICRHAMRLLWDTVGVDDVEEALDFPEGCLQG